MKGSLANHIYTLSILILCMSLSNSCTRDIQGTPVASIHPAVSSADLPSRMPAMERKLDEMSRIAENSVFTEKRGYPEYKIGALDILEITSRIGSEHKTDTVMVRSDGTISYAFVDDLTVEGLTVSELDDALTKRLAVFLKSPRVDIVVKEFKSKSALVMGEVGAFRYAHDQAASGRLYLNGKMTLLDLLVMAGGYTKDADIKKVKLIRGDTSYFINLYDLIYRGEIEQNVIIDDGDVIDVPELPEYGERVYVLGEVNRQGVYSLKDVPDLLAALSFAGSYTRTAVEENTLIIRGYQPGAKPLILTADVSAILKKGDISQNVPLMDGDILYVPRRIIGDINEFIVNTVPLLDYLLYPGHYRDAYGSYEHLRLKD
jgi:protein involved in polysaccharide export with SLBB domain